MMRFLLVAPIRRKSEVLCLKSGDDIDATTTEKRPLESRLHSQDQLLKQNWRDIDVSQSDEEQRHLDVQLAACCEIRGYTYYALEAELGNGVAENFDVAELESFLSQAAMNFISSKSDHASEDINWVARYALLSEKEKAPEGWLSTADEGVDVSAQCGTFIKKVRMALGWGNGAVFGWGHLSDETQMLTVRGIIDAQLIWNEASGISENNLEILENIELLQANPARKAVRALANKSSSNSLTSTRHQLLYDEVLLCIQGIRKIACLELLKSWGYEHFNGRIVERVSSAEVQVSGLQGRLNSRYQSAVEKILILLSMLTIVDLALSLISTAFSGSSDASLRTGVVGIFYWVREMNADLILGGSILITLLISLIFMRRR